MKTKTKRIWLAVTLLSVFAIAVGLLWKKELPPQTITLPNGEQYQFVAAEWGTNQVQPTFAARMVARLPAPVATYVCRKWGGRLGIVTPVVSGPLLVPGMGTIRLPPPEPALHFWFRSLSTNTTGAPLYGGLKFMLADQHGVVAGRGSFSMRGYSYGGDLWETFGQGTNRWLKCTLPVVPRRSELLQLHLFQSEELIETLSIRNPLFGRFPDWQPEPVPATKSSGDLKVRLTDFSVGVEELGRILATANGAQTSFRPPRPGEDPKVVFKFDTTSPRGTNATWQVSDAELSDATGNRVRGDNLSLVHRTGEYSLRTALWPDEAAWRLKLTLKRTRGFDPEELVTFTSIPVPSVGATNITFMTNRIQGVPVVLKQEFVRKPDVVTAAGGPWMAPTYVAIEAINAPDGFAVGFEQLIAATGWMPPHWGGTGPIGSSSINLNSIPTNLASLSFTWTVQKTRTVEFLVKPPKAK